MGQYNSRHVIKHVTSKLFKKLWDKRKKKIFLFFFNYLKTETRKNFEKNHTDVSLDDRCSSFFGKIFTPNLMIKKMFFSNKLIF